MTRVARPEILAPAGTPDRLEAALHFGADAVYVGLGQFSMRAFAGNFDADALAWGVAYAHERGRRLYVALNIQPFDDDLAGLEDAVRLVARVGADAVIVADPGVLALARRVAPALPVHLSTQASVTNAEAARFWLAQGVSRIVVARELDLPRLASVVAGAGGPIEAFAHGAVCIAYSGRCLLSLYWSGRDTRRGECASACRWRYREIEDSRRPGEGNRVEQDARGTYFFDAKDLCTIPVLEELLATGVCSLKIEGRTRSPYYVGVVVDVYRDAVDRLAAGDVEGFRARVPLYLEELRRAGPRDFSTHFLGGEENDPATYLPDGTRKDGRTEYVGVVVANTGEGLQVRIHNVLPGAARLEIRDRGLQVEQAILPPIDLARRGDIVTVPGRFAAQPGALVRHARP